MVLKSFFIEGYETFEVAAALSRGLAFPGQWLERNNCKWCVEVYDVVPGVGNNPVATLFQRKGEDVRLIAHVCWTVGGGE